MDYLLHGIPWATVQRMVVDAPSVETDGEGGNDPEPVAITADNAQDILNAINNLQR